MDSEIRPPPKKKVDSESENLRRIINNLPEDIILEILPKLPVKSLLRFKCVSKSWCSLISSEQFIKTHLDNSAKDPTFAHHKIISAFPKPNCRLKRHSLLSHSSNEVIRLSYDGNSIELTYPSSSIYAVRIVGSCNGLICLFLPENNFQLWNPSTGEHKTLPQTDTKGGEYTKYGFGFDEISGDYKVYAVFSWVVGFAYTNTNTVRVYSLKTNSWKSKSKSTSSPFDKKGILVNGKLHWIKLKKFRLKLWDINSFDLTSEAHGIVDQPRNLKGGCIVSLGELRGCLCVAVCDYKGEQLDVWIWKEYGVKDSWDKVVSINPYRLGYEPWEAAYSTPLYILPNGEILFKYGSTFLVYDRKHDRFSKTPEGVVGITGYYLYVESLVKLNSDHSQQQSQPWKFGMISFSMS